MSTLCVAASLLASVGERVVAVVVHARVVFRDVEDVSLRAETVRVAILGDVLSREVGSYCYREGEAEGIYVPCR